MSKCLAASDQPSAISQTCGTASDEEVSPSFPRSGWGTQIRDALIRLACQSAAARLPESSEVLFAAGGWARFCLILSLLATAGMSMGYAEEEATSLTDDSINRLVADLASDSRTVRATAEVALIAAGSSVLDRLPVVSSTPDPAVREGLERVIRGIEQEESKAALIAQPVRWSDTQTLDEAVERLARETGNSVTLPVGTQLAIVGPFPSAPLTFWEAIHWIEDHAALRYAAGNLERAPDQSPAPPVCVTGPFRVQLVDRSLRTTSGGTVLLGIKVRTTCEPRLRPLFLMASVDEWAVSHQASACGAFTPHARVEIPSGSDGAMDIAFDFVVPESIPDRTSWTISGQLELTLAARSSVVTFSDLTAKLPLTRRRGQASLSLLSIKSGEGGCSVRVASAFPEMAGLFESYRASLLAPELTLELSAGNRISPTEITQLQEDPDGIVLESHFPSPLPAGTRLQAIVPTAISTQKIPFRFEQITPAP